MKNFVINLDRSPQRLERMSALFDSLGLEFTRIAAVDGRQLPPAARPVSERGGGYRLADGEIGCFLSHIKCWQAIAEAPTEYSVVFEDDVHFGEDAGSILADPSWIPDDADIVKLETIMVRTFVDRCESGTVSGRSVRRLRQAHLGTGAYVISRRAARKLLELSTEITEPVDVFMFDPASHAWRHLVVYQVDPAVCIQDIVSEKGMSGSELASMLAIERPKPVKTKGIEKLFRELKRPLGRAATAALARLKGQSWIRIPFR
ncbi:glycosyltransferase family 25 protein [Aminobacter sp. HY435]|uniref:glycosyltransferase family 25 protein n=1 Tax=Aminobacter sp. HY435 TaxID=2970917 RepID=UPI0022B95DC6|nr:glycosyltransferase family 25 protein [Aminobacter sp. HY435]